MRFLEDPVDEGHADHCGEGHSRVVDEGVDLRQGVGVEDAEENRAEVNPEDDQGADSREPPYDVGREGEDTVDEEGDDIPHQSLVARVGEPTVGGGVEEKDVRL